MMKKFFTFIVAIVAMAGMQAETLTVYDETNTCSTLTWPIWIGPDYDYVDDDGYHWFSTQEGSITQMIYPADMLADMVNSDISQIKFYSTSTFHNYGGNVELSFLIVDFSSFVLYDLCFQDGAVLVANGAPVEGATELVFDLDQPYHYTGGNLLIQTKITERITTTNYTDNYYAFYTGLDFWDISSIYLSEMDMTYSRVYGHARALPKVTFTYERAGEPTEKTGAPTFHGYTEDGIHAYFVEIVPTEESTIYYRVQYPDGTWTEWAEYTEILSFTGNGKHRVEAYAIAQGKAKSKEIAYEFVVSPATGIDEVASGKQVADVRYFNMAGQEMQQAQGLTLVVTTYSDGTTSAVKVVK